MAKRKLKKLGKKKKQWFEGGTLHKATVAEWRAAQYGNCLATAFDFVRAASQMDISLISPQGGDEWLKYSVQLVTALSAGTETAAKETPNYPISSSAMLAMAVMGWIKSEEATE